MSERFFKIEFSGDTWDDIISKMLSFIGNLKGLNIEFPGGESNDNRGEGSVPARPAE